MLDLGYERGAVERRVAQGRLVAVHSGVYALGPRPLLAQGRRVAAVLAYGRRALLSHRGGAAEWGLIRYTPSVIDVMVPGGHLAARPGVRLHQPRTLHPEDRSTSDDGIPVTSIPRTLLDLAGVLTPHDLRLALEQSERIEKFDLNAMRRALARAY